jgi:hypothetical protein
MMMELEENKATKMMAERQGMMSKRCVRKRWESLSTKLRRRMMMTAKGA